VDSFLQVQTAEVNLYGIQQAFIQLGTDALFNRVELYKALGGGWQQDAPIQAGAQDGQAPMQAS